MVSIKIFITAVVIFICAVQGFKIESLEKEISYFEDSDIIHTEIEINNNEFKMKKLLNYGKSKLKFLSEETNVQCQSRPEKHYSEILGFWPAFIGKMKKTGELIEFENSCFTKNTIKITEINEEKQSITIELKSDNKKHYLCKHAYLIATTNIFHPTAVFFSKTNKITLKNLKTEDFIEIKVNGIKIFEFCHGIIRSVFDFIKTKKMLTEQNESSDRTDPVHNLNKEFLEDNGFTFQDRPNKLVEIDPKNIKDGDLLTAGNIHHHSIIMLGAGSRVGHNAMTMWVGDELYVFESSV